MAVKSLTQKVEEKVDRSGGPDACHEWTGARFTNGYGHLNVKHVGNFLGHRLAWELAFGPIPAGLFVLHRCDNRPCCNPKHLFLGTQKDNAADMVSKNRHTSGERNGQARLTEEDVLEILASGETSSRAELAKRYGVGVKTIGSIQQRKCWRHLGGKSLGMRRKLTEDQVREIRALAGAKTQREIGKMFGIQQTTVSGIVRRMRWKSVA